MNKLELLTLAAKAAGITHVDYSNLDYDGRYGLVMIDSIGRHQGTWNPLLDSADAFKLASDLQISVRHFPACVEVDYPKIGLPVKLIGESPLVCDVSLGQDRLKVTRNLIVQVAAKLGNHKE